MTQSTFIPSSEGSKEEVLTEKEHTEGLKEEVLKEEEKQPTICIQYSGSTPKTVHTEV